jgi:DNA polymerase III sliding clamp (beta) subunit (PCNA family)
MKIRCSKKVFERTLTAFKDTHSSYEDILITTNDGKVILGPTGGAQSYQLSFMCEYDEQGSVEIDLTILSQIVEQLPDDDMTIEVTPDYRVRLLCGGKKYCCLGKSHITKKRGVLWAH